MERLLPFLRCPDCTAGDLQTASAALACPVCAASFPIKNGIPALVKQNNGLIRARLSAALKSSDRRWSFASHLVPSPSVNLVRTPALNAMRELLKQTSPSNVLVVGSGNQRADLAKTLQCSRNRIQLLCTDIDWSLDIDILCDAHDLPFQTHSFDAIITTAVLEHVLYPERVVSEFHRVLKPGGLLYSELPFMQQVHEAAFDFTRYTLSGHRRLLHAFAELDAGMIAGPGTALAWALEHFFLAFARRSISRGVIRLFARFAFSWVKYFDYFFRMRPAALDGASCTFFLGRSVETIVTDEAIVAAYFNSEP
jgi:SAM-dependent methyltransferase/uncharacterized protein YbaR (Trm112 family)